MAMKSLNIKIDESLYESIRTIGFIKKKPMAVIVREFLQNNVESQSPKLKEEMELILESDDEKKVLEILSKREFITQEEFDKKFGFDK
ncbi:MAG: hypothetical protein AABZ74_03735 [Cyanobacteriota bacterium]